MAKLTASGVQNKREPGRYGDGLWLEVATPQRRAWFRRYMRNGKARTMALGDAEHVSLKQAREEAADARKLVGQGIDPIDHRRASREAETCGARRMVIGTRLNRAGVDAAANNIIRTARATARFFPQIAPERLDSFQSDIIDTA
jgi:hypothetical protein